MNNSQLGVDLGGTKIEGVVLTKGDITRRDRIPTPKEDYEAILTAVVKLVEEIASDLPADYPVGIGTPGSVSTVTGLLRNSNSTCLNGKPLRDDLEKVLDRPVRLANDADCFTLSEASDGAAAGGHNVFGVILGTGVGGGYCFDGNLVQGINGVAGEWGHNPLPLPADVPAGRDCFCGKRDCVETWLAGPGLEKSYFLASGEQLPASDIVNLDTEVARQVMDQYFELLARALAVVINIIDPDVIVFGGGMSNTPSLCDEVSMRLNIFSDHIHTKLVTAQHGDSSGVRGAAWLWPT